jgi:hypothetical protein
MATSTHLDRESEKCSQCGRSDYALHFLWRDGKPYCDDCAAEIGLTEDNEDGAEACASL